MAFRHVGQILPKFLQQHSLAQITQASQITEYWPRLAKNLFPSPLDKEVVAISFRQGTLLLRVPSNLVAQEIQFKQPQILTAYQELLGTLLVTKLRFRVLPSLDEQPQTAHRTKFKLSRPQPPAPD